MTTSTSLLQDLLQVVPTLQVQTYFKNTLTALSHAMEDLVLAGDERPLVMANFQKERFYRQEVRRYQQIAQKTDQVYVLAMPETDFVSMPAPYATIGLEAADPLSQEWHLVIVGETYSACLVCREVIAEDATEGWSDLDTARQFQGFWTFDPRLSRQAAQLLLKRVICYRPDLKDQVEAVRSQYRLLETDLRDIDFSHPNLSDASRSDFSGLTIHQFSDRLVNYLQTSQLRQVQSYISLTQMNAKLSAIEQMQHNLIAIVGHELRTPLSTIQICLESLSTEPGMTKDHQQVMLDLALSDSERLRKLVQDFLLLSQLESGQLSWQVESIDLADVIALTLSHFQSGTAIATPKVTVKLPKRLPILRNDGEAVTQLLNKLLDNAFKFTPATGKVTVQVKVLPAAIEIQIADTGCGIEANRLETIFDRFYQEEGFLRRSIGGTGLGLAICRQLTARLGGEIWATSGGKGKGSQFFVRLPIEN